MEPARGFNSASPSLTAGNISELNIQYCHLVQISVAPSESGSGPLSPSLTLWRVESNEFFSAVCLKDWPPAQFHPEQCLKWAFHGLSIPQYISWYISPCIWLCWIFYAVYRKLRWSLAYIPAITCQKKRDIKSSSIPESILFTCRLNYNLSDSYNKEHSTSVY